MSSEFERRIVGHLQVTEVKSVIRLLSVCTALRKVRRYRHVGNRNKIEMAKPGILSELLKRLQIFLVGFDKRVKLIKNEYNSFQFICSYYFRYPTFERRNIGVQVDLVLMENLLDITEQLVQRLFRARGLLQLRDKLVYSLNACVQVCKFSLH
ncbi:hypothetical protein DSECCO2_405690 [anaerobic digester metagenome]